MARSGSGLVRAGMALALAGCATAPAESNPPAGGDAGGTDKAPFDSASPPNDGPADSSVGAPRDGAIGPDGTGAVTRTDAASVADGGGDGNNRPDAAGEVDSSAQDGQGAPDAGADSNRPTDSGTPDSGKGEGLLVNGALAFPAPGSRGICPDPSLRITFPAPPKLGNTGKIQVFNASQPGALVASVDMGATSFTDVIGGMSFNTERPAYVDGNDVVVYLKSQALAYGQTYYVTVDAGAIVPPTGTLSIADTTTWRFSTAAAAPTNLAMLTVALDGSGDFCSVQGAIDALPANNTVAAQIVIGTGTYHEIIHFQSKNNVTLLGQSRTGTIIEGTNNNNLNPSTKARSLVGIDKASGLVIDTLTITNLTPEGGSQAEALRLQSCDQCVVRNANVNSLQDTLLWEGRVYADNCTIAGNVDFVWGGGAAYFNKCQIHTSGQAGAIVQARNTPATYGYVFVDSELTADFNVTGQVLARIDVSQYPGSHVAYINCTMGGFIAPGGWTITGGTSTSQLRFWEYQSVDTSGQAIDVSRRVAGSKQISAADAASMRTPSVVLSGWTPP